MHSEVQDAVVFLSGERLYLRPLEQADAHRCQRWFNDPETRGFLETVRPMSEGPERKFIEEQGQREDRVVLAIVLREGDRHIGVLDLRDIAWVNRHASLGIVIGEREARDRGYGEEALRLLLAHAFGSLNLHRIQLDVYAFNERAIRLYERLGFVREGVLREHRYIGGKYIDVLRYAILAREFAPGQPGAF